MKQGEIFLGAEIQKTRPAIIVNDNALGKLPLKIIVPITDWKNRYDLAPWMVKIVPDSRNNLSKVSSSDCFQVRSLSEQRFVKLIGSVKTEAMDNIRESLAKVLSIDV